MAKTFFAKKRLAKKILKQKERKGDHYEKKF